MVSNLENKRVGFVAFDVEEGGYIDNSEEDRYDISDCIPFDTKEECLEKVKKSMIFDNEYILFEYEIAWNTYNIIVDFKLEA